MTKVHALITSCLLPVGFMVGAFTQASRAKPPKTEMQTREDVAVYMLRLGMMRWVGACYYEEAAGNVPKGIADKACTVDLKLGEVSHDPD